MIQMQDFYDVLDVAFDLLNTRLTFYPYTFTLYEFFLFCFVVSVIIIVIKSIFD